jgi:Protein of unknown function (DUF4446)
MRMLSTFTTNPLSLVVIILSIITLTLLILVIILWMKMRRFLIGIDAGSIKESLEYVGTNLKEVQQFRTDMEAYLTSVEKRLKKSVQSVHTVRFNPFKGTGGGGNQSFATAFLTEEGDGVVISSLYSRDHVSVYAKPVKKHASEHEISEEEKEALDEAKKNLRG